MEIYIVTKGTYSEYHIVHVFTDKSEANEFVREMNTGSRWSEYNIETWDTVTAVKALNKSNPENKWDVEMDIENGEINRISENHGAKGQSRFENEIAFWGIEALKPSHAIKIANERRLQLKAENLL